MLSRPWRAARNRPSGPFILNRGSEQAVGLKALFHCGTDIRDVVGGLQLVGTRNAQGVNAGGMGMRFSATDEGAEATTPAYLKLAPPISIDVWCIHVGTPDVNGGIFGVRYDNAAGSPFTCYTIDIDGSGNYVMFGNDAGAFRSLNTTTAPVVGALTHICGAISADNIQIYVNGRLAIGDNASGWTPTYGATSLLSVGDYSGISRNSNVVILDGRIWNRKISAEQAWLLYAPETRWDLYAVPSSRVFFDFTGATAKPLYATQAELAQFVRLTTRARAVTQGQSPLVLKAVSKTFSSAVQATAATLSNLRVRLTALFATQAQLATRSRLIMYGKSVLATQAQVVTVTKAIAKFRVAVQATLASIGTQVNTGGGVAHFLSLFAAQAVVASFSRYKVSLRPANTDAQLSAANPANTDAKLGTDLPANADIV